MSLVTIASDHGIELAEVASFPTIPMVIGGVLVILVGFIISTKTDLFGVGVIMAILGVVLTFFCGVMLPSNAVLDAERATLNDLETFYGVDFTDMPYIKVSPKNPSEPHRSFIEDVIKDNGTVYPKVMVTQKDSRVSLSIPVDAEATEYVDLHEAENNK